MLITRNKRKHPKNVFTFFTWWETLLNSFTSWLLFSFHSCTSKVINPLHEDKPAATWKLPRCLCPTHFNISLELEISKEKK